MAGGTAFLRRLHLLVCLLSTKHNVVLVSRSPKTQRNTMDTEVEHQHHTEHKVEEENKAEDELESEEEELCSSDSEIGDALDWLDSRDEGEVLEGSFSSSSSLSCWRPNAHGGHHSHSSTLQPLSNRNQKFSHHIRASPLEVLLPFLKTKTLSLSFMPLASLRAYNCNKPI